MLNGDHIRQAGLMGLELVFISATLLVLYRFRNRIGNAPLLLSLGAFFVLQNDLAIWLEVEVAPRLSISPGSAVLFPANLLIVALLYLNRELVRLRGFCIGIVAVQLMLVVLSVPLGWQYGPLATAAGGPWQGAALSGWNCAMSFASTLLLVVAIFVLILVYERPIIRLPFVVGGELRRLPMTIRLFLSFFVPLNVDAVLYWTTQRLVVGDARQSDLVAHLAAKSAVSAYFALLLPAYARRFDPKLWAMMSHIRPYPMARAFASYLVQGERAYGPLATAVRTFQTDPKTGLQNKSLIEVEVGNSIADAANRSAPFTVLVFRFRQGRPFEPWQEACLARILARAFDRDRACLYSLNDEPADAQPRNSSEIGLILNGLDFGETKDQVVRRLRRAVKELLREPAARAAAPAGGGGLADLFADGALLFAFGSDVFRPESLDRRRGYRAKDVINGARRQANWAPDDELIPLDVRRYRCTLVEFLDDHAVCEAEVAGRRLNIGIPMNQLRHVAPGRRPGGSIATGTVLEWVPDLGRVTVLPPGQDDGAEEYPDTFDEDDRAFMSELGARRKPLQAVAAAPIRSDQGAVRPAAPGRTRSEDE